MADTTFPYHAPGSDGLPCMRPVNSGVQTVSHSHKMGKQVIKMARMARMAKRMRPTRPYRRKVKYY